MSFQLNKNLGNWLAQLNGKIVDKIFQVDFNKDRDEDIYLPWIFFITFSNFDRFLEIEGDFDGNHIRINLYDNSTLGNKLKENNFPDEPDCWRVYNTNKNEMLGQLLGQKIEFIEYGINKDGFEINGTTIKGQKDVFNFIKFYFINFNITIFEGHATGLEVSDDKNVRLNFAETFEVFNTNLSS